VGRDEQAGPQRHQRDGRGGCTVTTVVKITEAPCHIIVIIPLDVQFLDGVVDIVCQLDIRGRGPAALVVVRRDVRAHGAQRTQTLPCHHLITSFSFNDLDACVVFFRASDAPVPPPVEGLASWVG